ncbi:hypothetical protein [Lysobacter gummosus]|uniref:hypothetical protein n=1 Tax=Lysobacter gummosus TaxID=262324 RepID=UPI003630CFBE
MSADGRRESGGRAGSDGARRSSANATRVDDRRSGFGGSLSDGAAAHRVAAAVRLSDDVADRRVVRSCRDNLRTRTEPAAMNAPAPSSPICPPASAAPSRPMSAPSR